MENIFWAAFEDELEKLSAYGNPLWDVDMEEGDEPKIKRFQYDHTKCAPTANVSLQKEAKLRVGDIEDELGAFVGGKDEDKVRSLIARQRSKRFGMRHPLLTGIPTAGIWPAISKSKAKRAITKRMLRDDPKFRTTYNSKIRQQRADAAAAIQARIDSDRANAPRNAVAASTLPLSMYLKHKDRERSER